MTTLAIDGGAPEVRGPLKPFNTIGSDEIAAAIRVVGGGCLSGFLGGELRGGHYVRALEDAWCETFGVRHAVACNSATSGLLAACAAVGVKPGDEVITTPFTMSATSAAAALLGARLVYADIEPDYFCLDVLQTRLARSAIKAIIVANIFGHPAQISELRTYCDHHGVFLIEDNAQSPFAMESRTQINRPRYAGTVGHIGVFSLNCHKHIQTGEGGICVTESNDLARRMRLFINHAEMTDGAP